METNQNKDSREVIKKLRYKAEMTVSDLAAFLRISTRTVRKWETGEYSVPYSVVLSLKYYIKYGDLNNK